MENVAFVVYQRRLPTSQRVATKIPGASRRVLNVQLKELESHELIEKYLLLATIVP
jgi:DNA-binding HxlR family transcriptional regulator